ncbi:MAG: dihydroneopterin aldolase [Flavobacteriaceae bacterium]|nr:dihydroneopterin aldolase [Flavobacteriaceae bacterium]
MYKPLTSIKLNDIRIFAQHGCMQEERKIGSDYLVQLHVKAHVSKAAESDDLNDTVDYVWLLDVVKIAMAEPSNLLEEVAKRIIDAIVTDERIHSIAVEIQKINPPIEGDIASVELGLRWERTLR